MRGPLMAIIVITILLIVPMSLWTDRNLDFWISYFHNSPIDVPYWFSLLITIIFDEAVFILNIILEILRMVVS